MQIDEDLLGILIDSGKEAFLKIGPAIQMY